MPSPLDPQVLKGVVPPALVAAVILIVTHLAKGDPRGTRRRLGLALALAGGFAAGYHALVSWPGWMPRQALGWSVHLAAAGLFAVVARLRRRDGTIEAILWRLALSGGAVALLLRFMWRSRWQGSDVWQQPLAIALTLFAALSLADFAARRARGPALPGVAAFTAAAAGQTFFLFHSGLLAQLCGVLGTLFGVVALLGLLRRDLELSGGVIELGWLLFGAILAHGFHVSDGLPQRAVLGFAFLPTVGLLAAVPLPKRLQSAFWRQALVIVVGLAVLWFLFLYAKAHVPVSEYDDLYR